jgi:formate hydrogenlyase subunit 3/multisubunit Na+/H+ antiporter MnhD subunit
MRRPKRPLFLARAPYRRRRLRDAARLLPVLGLFLLLLPLLWTPDARLSLDSGDVIYFFGVWLALIGLAAGFAPGLRGGDGADDEED